MKKLLILALLGLILGAGAWKVQNPDGTVSDVRNQALALRERLASGMQAVSLAGGQTDAGSYQQAMEERLSRLENSVNMGTQGEQPSTSALLAEATQGAEAGNAANIVRLDAIDSRLALLVRRLDEQTVDEGLLHVQDTVDALGQDVISLRESANNREASLSGELSTVSEQLTALNLRLDTLTTGSLHTTAPAAENNAAGISTLAISLDERFKALETQLATVNTDTRRITTLSEQLASAREEIKQLQQSTTSNQQSVSQLQSSVTELSVANEALSIDIEQADIRNQLTQLQSQLESQASAGNTAELQTLLDTTYSRLQSLNERIQAFPATSTDAMTVQETQTSLESLIASLGNRLKETGTTTQANLSDTPSNAQDSVDQPASDNFVTPEDLRAQTELQAVQYKIYFNRSSVEITDDAATVLDSFITQEKNRTTGISIFGFTDKLGSPTYNQQLALQRATNVRSYLIKNGFEYTRIKALSGLGEDVASAVLPDNANDAQQRVVMLYAAQP